VVSEKVKLYEERKNLRKAYDKGEISEKEFRTERSRLTSALESEKAKSLERYEKEAPKPVQSIPTKTDNLKYYYDAQGTVIGVEDTATGESRVVQKESVKTFSQQTYQPIEPMSPIKPNIEPQKSVEKFTKQDEERQKRIEELIKREERLETFKKAIYERTGLASKDERVTPLNVLKAVGRVPVEFATMPLKIGGRIGLAGEALTYKAGRTELSRAAKATPRAIIESYDVRKPEGIVNLGLTVVGVRNLAKARASSLAIKKGFQTTKEIGVTSRVSRLEKQPQKAFRAADIRDTTKAIVEGRIGKKVYKGSSEIKTEYIKIGKQKYTFKGEGKSTIGKDIIKIETKGLVKPKEAVSYTKAISKGKTTEYGSISRAKQLAKEPFEITRTDTLTGRISKKGVKDIRKTSGYEIEKFRKEVLSESGKPIAREQTFQTQKISASETFLSKYYKTTPKINQKNIPKARESFVSDYGIIKQKAITKTTPQQTSRILSELKQQVIQKAKTTELKQIQVSKGISKLSVGGLQIKPAKPTLEQPKIVSKEIQDLRISSKGETKTRTEVKFISKTKEEIKAIKTPIFKPTAKEIRTPKEIQEVKPISKEITMPKEITIPKEITTPTLEPPQLKTTIPPQTPIPPTPPTSIIKTPPSIFLPPFIPKLMSSVSRSASRSFLDKKRKLQYAPSLLGIARGVKATKTANLSGLEIRGIQSGFKEQTQKSLSFGRSTLKPVSDGISMKFKVIKPKRKKYESVGKNMIKRLRSVRI
jgi:hypothetical protein